MLGAAKPRPVGRAAMAGAVKRLAILPAVPAGRHTGSRVNQPRCWNNNWADWDNSGHNDWEDWAPSPPGG